MNTTSPTDTADLVSVSPSELAEKFKRQGHFDIISNDLLTQFTNRHNERFADEVRQVCEAYLQADKSASRHDRSTLIRRTTKEVNTEMESTLKNIQRDIENELRTSDEWRERIDEELARLVMEMEREQQQQQSPPPAAAATLPPKAAELPRKSSATIISSSSSAPMDMLGQLLSMASKREHEAAAAKARAESEARAKAEAEARARAEAERAALLQHQLKLPPLPLQKLTPKIGADEQPSKDADEEVPHAGGDDFIESSDEGSLSTAQSSSGISDTSDSEKNDNDKIPYSPRGDHQPAGRRRASSVNTATTAPAVAPIVADTAELFAEVFKRGQKLAAYVQLEDKDTSKVEKCWMVVIVKSFDECTGLYTCRDVETRSDEYDVPFERLAHFNHTDAEYRVGDHVLSLYRLKIGRLSSVFYPAVVTQVTNNIVHVRFEDGNTAVLKYSELFKDPHKQ